MNDLPGLLLPAVLLAAATAIGRTSSPRVARRLAIAVMSVGAAACLGWSLFSSMAGSALAGLPDPVGAPEVLALHRWTPFSIGLIGFAAVAVSPARGAASWTFGRIVAQIALALALPILDHPLALAAVWAGSALVAWLEVRAADRDCARLFAFYHVPSAILVVVGSWLFASGRLVAAVPVLVLGIGIREAVVPLHSWFPPFVEKTPLGAVVAFAAPQLGLVLHLRMVSGGISSDFAYDVALVGVVTLVFAAGLALAQTEGRRALAYLVMSQSGLVAFGLENHTVLAHAGGLAMAQVIGLATAGFAMTLAAVEARRGRVRLEVDGGSMASVPKMAAAFLLLGFASVGLPLTAGFVAEDLLVQGSVEEFPFLGLALILATALNGITVMRLFFGVFAGSRPTRGEQDLLPRELAGVTIILATLLVGGLAPALWFS